MMSNKKGFYHLSVKKLSTLLRGTASANNDKLCCLNCLHSFRTKNKLKCHEKIMKRKIFAELLCHLKKSTN